MRILVCDDDPRVRARWIHVVQTTLDSADVTSPDCQSVECFLQEIRPCISGRTFDITILDLLFIDDVPKHSAGMKLWEELKDDPGRSQFGILILATRFAGTEISEFVSREGAILCNGMTDELRKAVLSEAIEECGRR